MGEAGESALAEVGCERGGFGGRVIWIKQFDRFIGSARKQFPIRRPANPLNDILMRRVVPNLALCCKVPDFDHAITTPTSKSFQRARVLGHCVNTVDMAFAHLAQEGRSEKTLHLYGIESSCILTRTFERMLGRV
jgi:hypothetical protein